MISTHIAPAISVEVDCLRLPTSLCFYSSTKHGGQHIEKDHIGENAYRSMNYKAVAHLYMTFQ